MDDEAITLKAVIQFKHPIKAPRGVTGEFRAIITDEKCEWTFRDRLSTMILANELSQKNTPDEKVTFNIKKSIAITEYAGKTKEEIKDKLIKELERFKKR